MKLNLSVPVEKVYINESVFTFRHEIRECDVIGVIRHRATRTGPIKYKYTAFFDHPDAHPEACRIGPGKTLTEWIPRAKHPEWKPPAFADGSSVFYYKESK